MQRLKSSRDLEEKKAVLLAKLEEAEGGERAALLEASRIKEDNEGLKVSQSVRLSFWELGSHCTPSLSLIQIGVGYVKGVLTCSMPVPLH